MGGWVRRTVFLLPASYLQAGLDHISRGGGPGAHGTSEATSSEEGRNGVFTLLFWSGKVGGWVGGLDRVRKGGWNELL